jgi:hypothetical protein
VRQGSWVLELLPLWPAPIAKTMQSLAIVYGAVIDDVLSKVRSEFVQEGNE